MRKTVRFNQNLDNVVYIYNNAEQNDCTYTTHHPSSLAPTPSVPKPTPTCMNQSSSAWPRRRPHIAPLDLSGLSSASRRTPAFDQVVTIVRHTSRKQERPKLTVDTRGFENTLRYNDQSPQYNCRSEDEEESTFKPTLTACF